MSYGRGSFPSIAFHEGALWLLLQDFAELRLYHGESLFATIPLSDDSAAFPVLASLDGTLWAAYRDRTDGVLLHVLTGQVLHVGQPGGNRPMQLADGCVWWLEGDGCWRMAVGAVVTPRIRVNDRVTPTGIIAIRNGQPVYWDDVAGSQPGMIVSSMVGSLVVGEGTQGGALVRDLTTGRERLHWPGEFSYKPSVAIAGDVYAIATWDQEVRVEFARVSELQAPGPSEPAPQDPPDVPPAPTLRKPEVTVDRWTLDELKDGREIVFHDRENPALGYAARVWVENGSLYASLTNAAGTGRTGARRPVKLQPPSSEPQTPEPPPPVVVTPQPIGWRPSRDEVLANLRADIAMTDADGQDTEWGTWEALWWDDAKFTEFAQRYRDRGLTLVPCDLVVGNVTPYRGVSFDFTNDIPLCKARLERCYQHGLIPMLGLTMVDAAERGAETIAILERILPELRDSLVAVFTAWEMVVTGEPSVYTPDEHAEIIALVRRHLKPETVLAVEFASPKDRRDVVIYDGRAVGEGKEAPDYWQRPDAREIDVVLLEFPHNALREDPRAVCMEVGGAVCRLQGLFIAPDRWPDGELIDESYLGNWRGDYGIRKRCVLFEYAASDRWSSARKRALRKFVQAVIPIAGFGEG